MKESQLEERYQALLNDMGMMAHETAKTAITFCKKIAKYNFGIGKVTVDEAGKFWVETFEELEDGYEVVFTYSGKHYNPEPDW